jgi:DNA repair protein RadC
MRIQRAEYPLKLNGLQAARRFFAGCFADSDPSLERLWVAHLDSQARCVHLTHHDGDQNGAFFPMHSIVADAALHGSAGLVLAHNHPSGDHRPSLEDCRATRRLASAVEALDCTMVDHLVFAGTQCTSFRSAGLL